ncbi:MAG: type II toxin-antitoxin system HipA family toxin [Limnobacter sp.]|nr:type II toxin-antitoxin system HipA family toxin [Limnobacter sp.]
MSLKLHVFVNDVPVATLDSPDSFKHVMTYHDQVKPDQFVSLLMPVQTESYTYPELHPIFKMNLPEGFLLSILKEELGPHVGASPLSLLSVVGRNAIGRVKVAPIGADPTTAPVPFELAEILKGDNSEEAFVRLVRRHAVSGVSGVVPKFLNNSIVELSKGTLATEHYIIKGTTARLPGVALNEHLCMQVARTAGLRTAQTQVSDDGQALIVSRFDTDAVTGNRLGMEDLCSLLALNPEQKYETTWEKVVNRIGDIILDIPQRNQALSELADLLILTYLLRNADCHSKNIALLYSSKSQIWLAPIYDMLTITVYDDYHLSPPGLSLAGRKTWMPGNEFVLFMQKRCNIKPSELQQRIESLCEAVVKVSPELIRTAQEYPHFQEIGKRMLRTWNEGMNSLRLKKTWSLPNLSSQIEQAQFSETAPVKKTKRAVVGRSPLLGERRST